MKEEKRHVCIANFYDDSKIVMSPKFTVPSFSSSCLSLFVLQLQMAAAAAAVALRRPRQAQERTANRVQRSSPL